MKNTEKLLKFIEKAPDCFHAVAEGEKIFAEAGFERLFETESWKLKKGGKYYVTRNGSSIIGFAVPEGDPAGLMLASAHSDSPSFKVKFNPEICGGPYIRLNTERYGGMIYSTWLDKPLSVAGRLVLKTKEGVETRLVNVDKDLLIIPNVAIHMNRDVNDGYKYNPAVDLVPLYGLSGDEGGFLSEVAETAGVEKEDILDYDLFLYNRQRGSVWGPENQLFSAPQIDDLQCAYSVVTALAEAEGGKALSVAAIFDNEEVGSLTKQGADSTFLEEVLSRVTKTLYGENSLCRLAASGMALSADNAHAVHPNHPEYADPNNRPEINKGIVVKYSANQKYTSDAVSSAVFCQICEKAKVPVQKFTNRSDMAGGSTLGNISNAHLSISSVDIGCPQLSMHSSYETAGCADTDYMVKAIKTFFETTLKVDGEKISIK